MLAEAERLRGLGEFSAAAAIVGAVLTFAGDDVQLHRAHALLLSDAGDHGLALNVLRRALLLAPRDAVIINSHGVILSRLGRHADALAAHDLALSLAPDFEEARLNRAITLQELGRYEEARTAYQGLAGVEARYAHAMFERSAGAPAVAAGILDDLIATEPRPEWLRARAIVALERLEPDAANRLATTRLAMAEDPDLLIADLLDGAGSVVEPLIEQRLALHPDWYAGLRALTTYRREAGEGDAWLAPFAAALSARPADPALWRELINGFSADHMFADAAAACHRAARATGDGAFIAAAFAFHSAAGNMPAASAIQADPRLAPHIAPLARAEHAVRCGALDEAGIILGRLCEAQPANVAAWAMRGIVWRMTGDDRSEWLTGQPGLVAVMDLSRYGLDCAEIAAVLDHLHETTRRPVGQSVRGGRQTRGNLFMADVPEISRLRTAIESALADFRAGLPSQDDRHPALRYRDAPWRFSASWSVSLPTGGHHISHIHPKGIFSSASYWCVPPDDAGNGEGALELGAAPPHLGVDLPPIREILPRVGQLVLFPSTLYHGTRTARAGRRLTAAFDLEPIPAGSR